MKKILLALILTSFQQVLFAQYYYKDILTTSQTNQLYNQLTRENIKKITLSSYDGNSAETAGFSCEQRVDNRKKTISTITRTAVMGDSFFEATYNEKGQLASSKDSAQNASSKAGYSYDADGRLLQISTSSTSDNVTTTETHQWSYDAAGKPSGMLRIRNNVDTTRVSFVLDENGNVVEEKAVRRNLPAVTVFYYYDQANRLTDIVRYNAKAQRLLPDYMFEYNENGQLKKMTVIPEGTNEYQIWYYQYLPNGLKRMELVYNKQQQLMGKVEYSYE
ncbi:hypothetical protein [Flavihumibacter stibioxidans]|nr:hypothetical protein [Flavihumibacter stibioxidans]